MANFVGLFYLHSSRQLREIRMCLHYFAMTRKLGFFSYKLTRMCDQNIQNRCDYFVKFEGDISGRKTNFRFHFDLVQENK